MTVELFKRDICFKSDLLDSCLSDKCKWHACISITDTVYGIACQLWYISLICRDGDIASYEC